MFFIPQRHRFPTIIGRYIVSNGETVALVQASTPTWLTSEEYGALAAEGNRAFGTVIEEWALTDGSDRAVHFKADDTLGQDFGKEHTLVKHPGRMPWPNRLSPKPQDETTWTHKGDGTKSAAFRKGVEAALDHGKDLHYVKGRATISHALPDPPNIIERTKNGRYRRWCEVIQGPRSRVIGYVYAEWSRSMKAPRETTTRIWQLSLADSMTKHFTVDTGHPGGPDAVKPGCFKDWYTSAFEDLSKGGACDVDFAAGKAHGYKSLRKPGKS